MARVTVEDCILLVPNRFELVAYASQRARDIASGTPITVDRDNDKDSVVSLREIAKGSVPVQQLREELIQSYQRSIDTDEIAGNEPENAGLMNAAEVAEEMKSLQVNDADEDDLADDAEGEADDENLEGETFEDEATAED